MPLPTDTPLSLQGFSAAQSKPKQAVVVRMSAETLDALDALPAGAKIEFEYPSNPTGAATPVRTASSPHAARPAPSSPQTAR
jgi:hypothetical protein